MNWFILLLLVPLILVPIVLLCGYAGCTIIAGLDGEFTYVTRSPADFNATANGTTKIDLQWTHSSPIARFTVKRSKPSIKEIATSIVANSTSDSDLNDGTEYTYFLTALDAADSAVPSQPPRVAQATTLPNAPSPPTATPSGTNQIKLVWKHDTKSPKPVTFKLIDTLKSGAGVSSSDLVNAEKVGATFTFFQTVEPGSTHEFQVVAVVNRFDDLPIPPNPQTVESAPSQPPVPGSPVIINPIAFQAGPGTSANQPGIQGATIVQLLSKSELKSGGSTVKITLRGADPTLPDAGPLTVDRVYISQVDLTPGRDPYDSLASGPSGLTRVFDSSPPFNDLKVTLAPGDSKPLDVVPYTLVPTQDLLIAFDISTTVGQGTLRFAPQAGAVSYARLAPPGMAVQESAVADRTPGYAPANNNLYMIEKIEVS